MEAMDRHPERERFFASLPVMGVDGTLSSRLRGTPVEGRVHAKTGTLTGVRALSGYLTTAAGERLAFAMIVNHHTLSAADADRVAHAALLRLVDLPASRVPGAF
jgi:serine-type D-Ala-D-Ala carboxypeptidase/endopeptidase (penicillin-binding protein 4)